MLIRTPLPPGHIYPQITDAPISTYADFLNFFRGGHTIDDNLAATSVASTVQAGGMLRTAIASGHLTKAKNMAVQNEFLADITLTKSGAELIQSFFDRKFCEEAIDEARKSVAEDDRPHPKVGVVIVKDGKILGSGHRGESGKGDHAEYCGLKKLNAADVQGAAVYTTLEPCSTRNPPKTSCTDRLIESKVARVVYGLADKDETVYGHASLVEAGIAVAVFADDLMQELLILNKPWSDTRRKPELMPPPNRIGWLANASYYKPGTPMTDNIHLVVRPPKDADGFFTVEDSACNVLAYARTFEEIAVKWHQIDTQKRIVEKLRLVASGSSDQRLGLT
jgi:pyrimidine deaminase RibD-like protein